MRGEVEVSNFHLAALCVYEGLECVRCRTTNTETVWTFRCPEFDAAAIKSDFDSPATSVLLEAWIKAQGVTGELQHKSRNAFGGEWVSQRYSKI